MHMNFILSLMLLNVLIYGQTDLQTQYCSLKTNTTGQIIMRLTPVSQTRPSTELIIRSQLYTFNGALVSLSYIENEGSLSIEETDTTQTTKVHNDNSQNTLIYIDSKSQYILAKQITDQQSREFNYVLFIANLGTSGNMVKYSFDSKLDSTSKDISKLSIKKIIDIQQGLLYVILKGKSSTSIYTLSTVSGGQINHFSDLSNTQALNIIDGNLNNLYDSSNKVFYEKSSSQATFYTSKTFTQLGIDSILTASNLVFNYIQGFMLVHSQNNGVMNVLPIGNQAINVSKALSISGAYSIFTDKHKNFVVVTSSDLVWFKVTDTGLANGQLSKISLDSTVKQKILEIFNLAESVSFSSKNAVIIKKETSKKKGSLYSITFDPTATPKLKILDEYVNSLNLVDSTSKNLVSPSAVSGYQSSFTCNCVSSKIESINCYGSAYKCVTITSPKREICTKS